MDEILARYPTTLKLTFGSIALGIVVGVIVGIISGVYSANMINGYVWAFLEEKKRAKKAAKA